MLWFTVSFISIFCITAVHNHCDNNVDLQLETVLEFDPNEEAGDLKIIDNLEHILKSVRKSVVNKQRHKNDKTRQHNDYSKFADVSRTKTNNHKVNNTILIRVVKDKISEKPNETNESLEDVFKKEKKNRTAAKNRGNNDKSRKNREKEKWKPNLNHIAGLVRSLDDKDLDTLVDTVDNEMKKQLTKSDLDQNGTVKKGMKFLKKIPKRLLRSYLYEAGNVDGENQEETKQKTELFVELGRIIKSITEAFLGVKGTNKKETEIHDNISSASKERPKPIKKPSFDEEIDKKRFKQIVKTAIRGLIDENGSQENTENKQIIQEKLKRLLNNLNSSPEYSEEQENQTENPTTDKSFWHSLFDISFMTTRETTTKFTNGDDHIESNRSSNRDEIDDYLEEYQLISTTATTKHSHRHKTKQAAILEEGETYSSPKHKTKPNRHKHKHHSTTRMRDDKRQRNKHQRKKDNNKSYTRAKHISNKKRKKPNNDEETEKVKNKHNKTSSEENKERKRNLERELANGKINTYENIAKKGVRQMASEESLEMESKTSDKPPFGDFHVNEAKIAVLKNRAKLEFWTPQNKSSLKTTPKIIFPDYSIEVHARAEDSNEGISIEVAKTNNTELSKDSKAGSIDNAPFETEKVNYTTLEPPRRQISHVFKRIIGNYKYTTKDKSLRRQDSNKCLENTTVGLSTDADFLKTPEIAGKIEKRIDNLEQKFKNIEKIIQVINSTTTEAKQTTLKFKNVTQNSTVSTIKVTNQTILPSNKTTASKNSTENTKIHRYEVEHIKDNEILTNKTNKSSYLTIAISSSGFNVSISNSTFRTETLSTGSKNNATSTKSYF